MRGYTIFDHAQYGHDEKPRRKAKRKPKKISERRSGRPRQTKWFDTLGLGPQFNKPKRTSECTPNP